MNIECVSVEMVFIFYDVFLLSLYSLVPGPRKAALRREDALPKAKFFQDKEYISRVARNSRYRTVQNFTRNTFRTSKSVKKMIKTVPRGHDKGSA